jgi:hypothetical protein
MLYLLVANRATRPRLQLVLLLRGAGDAANAFPSGAALRPVVARVRVVATEANGSPFKRAASIMLLPAVSLVRYDFPGCP